MYFTNVLCYLIVGNDEQCSGALAQVFRLSLWVRRRREDVYVVTGAIIYPKTLGT